MSGEGSEAQLPSRLPEWYTRAPFVPTPKVWRPQDNGFASLARVLVWRENDREVINLSSTLAMAEHRFNLVVSCRQVLNLHQAKSHFR